MKSVLALIGPTISQVSTVTNMSTPLQADLSSVVEKGARDARYIANFLGQSTVNEEGKGGDGRGRVCGGEGKLRINVYAYEKARVSEKEKKYREIEKERKKTE